MCPRKQALGVYSWRQARLLNGKKGSLLDADSTTAALLKIASSTINLSGVPITVLGFTVQMKAEAFENFAMQKVGHGVTAIPTHVPRLPQWPPSLVRSCPSMNGIPSPPPPSSNSEQDSESTVPTLIIQHVIRSYLLHPQQAPLLRSGLPTETPCKCGIVELRSQRSSSC
jgi:hypothetical protein